MAGAALSHWIDRFPLLSLDEKWIFIVLGLISIVTGSLSFKLCHDYPATARFLTPREREYAVARLLSDDQYAASGERFKWRYVKEVFSEAKVLVLSGRKNHLF